jgi:Na+-driven multidrug efflux pump
MAALDLFSGPVFVLGLYFQAIGEPAIAGLLTVAKPFILLPILLVVIAALWGADAIWFAYPLVDGVAAAIAMVVLATSIKARGINHGIGLKGTESLS